MQASVAPSPAGQAHVDLRPPQRRRRSSAQTISATPRIARCSGVKGDINEAWSYDTYFQNGVTRFSEEYFNDVSKSRMSNALQAVTGPAGQSSAPRTPTALTKPRDACPGISSSSGGVTPAAVELHLGAGRVQKGFTKNGLGSRSVTGDLGKMGMKLPMANHGLGVSFGADWRQEKSPAASRMRSSSPTTSPARARRLCRPTAHSRSGKAYTEARLPLIEDKPFAKSLSVEAGYRYSDYTLSFGSTNTLKAGLEWAPTSDVRVRAMYNVAVRAPNMQELFLQPRVQLDGTVDPCSGPTPTATARSAHSAA